MSSNIQIRNFKPKIKVNIVLFTSLIGSIIFATGAGYYEELVVEAADGMSMAGIFEFIHRNAIECVGTIVND